MSRGSNDPIGVVKRRKAVSKFGSGSNCVFTRIVVMNYFCLWLLFFPANVIDSSSPDFSGIL